MSEENEELDVKCLALYVIPPKNFTELGYEKRIMEVIDKTVTKHVDYHFHRASFIYNKENKELAKLLERLVQHYYPQARLKPMEANFKKYANKAYTRRTTQALRMCTHILFLEAETMDITQKTTKHLMDSVIRQVYHIKLKEKDRVKEE